MPTVTPQMKTEPPIACNLGALDTEEQKRRADLADQLQNSVREILSRTDGFTLRFSANDLVLFQIAEFVSLERRCCPFLNFQISLNEGDDAIELRLSGRAGVKEFLAAEFGLEEDCRC